MLVEPPAEPRQASLASQRGRNLVIANRVGRAGDIRLLPPRQHLVVLAAQLGMLQSLRARPGASRPNAHQPDVREAELLPSSGFGIGHIGERDAEAALFRECAQPAPRVDLVEQWMGHGRGRRDTWKANRGA